LIRIKAKPVFAATCVAAATWPIAGTFADDVRVPFELPNCPTTLVLSAPEIFAGAENQQELAEQIGGDAMLSGLGTIVQVLIAPAEPTVILMLAERSDVSDIQGSATREQFDQLKARLLAANGQSEKALVNERGQEQGVSVNDYSITSATSSETSVTLVGQSDVTAQSADFASYLGMSVGHAKQCIPMAIVVAPTSLMPQEAFEELMRGFSFE